MKKTNLLNSKKIIIFILLVIGIILISPIINKEVFAKTGKLPAQLTKGNFQGNKDGIITKLEEAQNKYTATDGYKANDKFTGTIEPELVESDEFWTAKGTKKQVFDEITFETNSIKEGDSNLSKNKDELHEHYYTDYNRNNDLYCTQKDVYVYTKLKPFAEIYGPGYKNSDFLIRLEDFISERSEALQATADREKAFQLHESLATKRTIFDAYKVNNTIGVYNGPDRQDISKQEMKDRFGYDDPDLPDGTITTYPYIIRNVEFDNVSYRNLVVPVNNNKQYASFQVWERYINGDISAKTIYSLTMEKVLREEIAKYYNHPGQLTSTGLIMDESDRLRTGSYYEFIREEALTPQAIYTLLKAYDKYDYVPEANKPSKGNRINEEEANNYPGDAQKVLWTLKDAMEIDPRAGRDEATTYFIREKDTKAIELKALAEAYEAHHHNLTEFLSKNENKFKPKFLETDLKTIFNTNSNKYEQGSWLIGPFKLDYLLSTVSLNKKGEYHTDNPLYFAGMTDMKVYGFYIEEDKTTGTKTGVQKEIMQWEFFIPLKYSEKELREDLIPTEVTNDIPEPNQEFYLEIPYDENLAGIDELRAYFKALDHQDAMIEHYYGIGEYVEFSLNVEIEKMQSMSHAYEKVKAPTEVRVDYYNNDELIDLRVVTMRFEHEVFINSVSHCLDPFCNYNNCDHPKWSYTSPQKNEIKAIIKYNHQQKGPDNPKIYYRYDAGVYAEGTSNITGGTSGYANFSKPYTYDQTWKELFGVYKEIPEIKLESLSSNSDSVTFEFNLLVKCDGIFPPLSYNTRHTIDRKVGNGTDIYTFTTYSGQTCQVSVDRKTPPPPPPLSLITREVYSLNPNFIYFEFNKPTDCIRWNDNVTIKYSASKHYILRPNGFENDLYIFRSASGEDLVYNVPGISWGYNIGKNTDSQQLNLFDFSKTVANANKNSVADEIKGEKANFYGNSTGNNYPPTDVSSGITYGDDLKEDYTYVLYKYPDALVVPKAKILKQAMQPQGKVRGKSIIHEEVAILKLNLFGLTGKLLEPPGTTEPPVDPIPVTYEEQAPVAFMLPIGGKVWEDKPFGDKLSAYNFLFKTDYVTEDGTIKDENDIVKENIIVKINRVILTKDKKTIVKKQKARVFTSEDFLNPINTDENPIKTNENGEWGKYYLRDLGFTREEIAAGLDNDKNVVKFEVEFYYNGVEYIPVSPLISLNYEASKYNLTNEEKVINDSMAVENLNKRAEFNKEIGEIVGYSPMQKVDEDGNTTTEGRAIGVDGVLGDDLKIEYTGKINEESNRTVSEYKLEKTMMASTLNTGLLYPFGEVYAIDLKQAVSENKASVSEENGSFDVAMIMTKEQSGQFKSLEGVSLVDALETLDKKAVVVFHESNTHMENINLGLLKRRPADLSLESDLMLSIQFVNKKALINNFANKYDISTTEEAKAKYDYLIQEYNRYDNEYHYLTSDYNKNPDDIQYKLDVYKADYIYRTAMYEDVVLKDVLKQEAERLKNDNNDKSGRELDIYLQYKQGITNYSKYDNAVITGIDMYYDETLEPVLKTITKETDKEELKEGEDGKKKVTGRASIAGNNVKITTSEYRIVGLDEQFTREFSNVKYDNNKENKDPNFKDIKLHGDYYWEEDTVSIPGVNKLTSLRNTENGEDELKGHGILIPSLRRLEIITNFRIKTDLEYTENGLKVINALRLGNKHHLTEISGYATYNKFNGIVSGKVDVDSAPENVNLELLNFNEDTFKSEEETSSTTLKQNFSYLEDDSASAPIIAIKLNDIAPRKVSGRIWEDKRNVQFARVNRGDGIFNSGQGEKPIENKIVALEERVSLKITDIKPEYRDKYKPADPDFAFNEDYYIDIPYIWSNCVNVEDIATGEKIVFIENLKEKTGFQSYLRSNGDGQYTFEGVPAGNFVLQLPYITVGNNTTKQLGILDNEKVETTKIVDADNRNKIAHVYNGQDFKVSIYDGGEDTLNETWIDAAPKENHSYGRDNEYQRFKIYKEAKIIDAKKGDALEILNKADSELNPTPDTTEAEALRKIIKDTANMVAETPLMNLGIDYYSQKDTENILYSNFDGIFALAGVTKSKDGEKDVTKSEESSEFKNINIALEERPRTKLVLDKQITRLTLSSSDGTKIVDAKYDTTYEIVMPKADDNIFNSTETEDKEININNDMDGYNTGEYVLKAETKINEESLNKDKVMPLNTKLYATDPAKIEFPYWEGEYSDSYKNAKGWENFANPEPPVSRNSNGYIHLNFDKQLLSDTNIEIEYQVKVFNLGEVDRVTIKADVDSMLVDNVEKDQNFAKYVGLLDNTKSYTKLYHEIDSDTYGFGRVLGKGYYTGKYKKDDLKSSGNYIVYEEEVAKTYADMIIDYIDNSAVKDDLSNNQWAQIKDIENLKEIVAAYDDSENKTFDLDKSYIADPDGKSYFTTDGSNIYINTTMNEGLVPYYEYVTAQKRGAALVVSPYTSTSTITIKRLSSQQADDDLSFDNIVEIVKYSTDAGRRTPSSTPGNIKTRESETFDGKNIESDTGLSLLLTITPPTGLSKAQLTTYSTLNIILVITVGIALTAVIIKVILETKKKNTVEENVE